MPYCSTSFRFSWASPVETTTGTGRSPPPSRERGKVGGHLGAVPALRVEEDEQHIPVAELGKPVADSREIGKLEIRRGHADRQAAGLPALLPGARRELFLDRLQPQQEAAILADELKPEPGSHADQQPGQNGSEYEGSHQGLPCWSAKQAMDIATGRADRAPEAMLGR